MGSIYRPRYVFSVFFANLQAQITVASADKERVTIGYLAGWLRVLHSLQP